jgi:hypothetical protein
MRAEIVLSLWMVCFSGSHGADYFVRADGNDSLTGTSPGSAWKSISRINEERFHPGDRVLFQAGEKFPGNLTLASNSDGDGELVIGSFGEGRAVIEAGSGTGLSAARGHVRIENLIFQGSGPEKNTGYGILFDNPRQTSRLEQVVIDHVDVEGFGKHGILITGQRAGFKQVCLENCRLSNNLRGGLEVAGRLPWDATEYAHQNVVVRRCEAFDNPGDPEYRQNHS